MKWYITKCCKSMFQSTAAEKGNWNPCTCRSTKAKLATKAKILQAV